MKPKPANALATASPRSEDEASRRHDSDGEDSVGGKECGICHDVPENIIYLSCAHIVCLVCAAKSILGAITDDAPINLGEVTCGICEEITALSEGVQETMIEFLGQQEFEDEEGGEGEEEEEEEEKGDNDSEENSVQIRSSGSRRKESESGEHGQSTAREKEAKNDSVVHHGRPSERQKRSAETAKETIPRRMQPSKPEEPKKRPKAEAETKPTKSTVRPPTDRKPTTPIPTTQNEAEESEGGEDEREEPATPTDTRANEEHSDFLSTFYCPKHADEEYTYYHTAKRTLLCSQCLLSEVESREDRAAIRPLKKCLPEILQNFQDMLNEIEVSRSLLENRAKDFEIRKEGAKAQAVSMAKKLELAFDELIDTVQEAKVSALKALEAKNKALLGDLEGREEAIEERMAFFGGVLDEVTSLRQNSQNPEEELFVFFFANQDRISKALETESVQNADSEAVKTNRVFEEFMIKTKQEQGRQCRLGQEAVRDKLNKNIMALGGTSVSELPDSHGQRTESKMGAMTADFPRQTTQAKPPTVRAPHTLVTLAEAENSTRLANLQAETDGRASCRGGAPYVASQTYGQFVEKVNNLPTRPATSLDVNTYLSGVRGFSRGPPTGPLPSGDSNGFSRDFTSSSYYKTVNKNSYNLEKKMELEQKLRLFDVKARKDDGGAPGYSSVLNRTGLTATAVLPTTSVLGKSRLDGRTDFRATQTSSLGSSLRSGGWMSGK